MGVYEINVPNVYSIMQANVLYAYSGNNPIMFVDPFGTTVTLTGITSEDDPRFVALQELTDDELTVDFLSGQVSVVTEAEGESLIRPTGTNLVRDLVNDEEFLEVVLTNENSGAGIKLTKDENENIVGYNYIMYFNPNQTASVMTVQGEKETPSYIILGHELIHSYRMINGTYVAEENVAYVYPLWEEYIVVERQNANEKVSYDPSKIEELETVGIPYATEPLYEPRGNAKEIYAIVSKQSKYVNAFTDNVYTENALRVENLLPVRMRY